MSGNGDWPVEDIPDADFLYYRLHKSYARDDNPIPLGAFKDRGGGMSTDWSKYASPEETRERAPKPEENGVVALHVGKVRSVPLDVTHSPDKKNNNRAHTDVIGEKTTEARVKLGRAVKEMVIALPA